jgi:hypothetical protein
MQNTTAENAASIMRGSIRPFLFSNYFQYGVGPLNYALYDEGGCEKVRGLVRDTWKGDGPEPVVEFYKVVIG